MADGSYRPEPGPLTLSVVICTRDRPASLRRALSTLCDLRLPPGLDWELLVIDNGERFPVADVAADYVGVLPIRVCPEPVAGITNARNRAVEAALGRYIVWTDDDVEVDPDWVAAYLDAFARWPDAAFFGGAASPRFEPPQQPWMDRFQDLLAPMLAKREPMAETQITADDLPYGLNFATKTAAVRQFRFDPAFGRAPGRTVAGEETDLFRRMLAAGLTGRWAPAARVSHIIPPQRQTVAYLYDYYAAAGREMVMRDGAELSRAPRRRRAIRVKAAALVLAALLPLSLPLGVSLRRAHAFNQGAAAALRGISQA
jgi:glucosyl-dolichyl phosphate glucuronosyltransferase